VHVYRLEAFRFAAEGNARPASNGLRTPDILKGHRPSTAATTPCPSPAAVATAPSPTATARFDLLASSRDGCTEAIMTS